MISQSLFKTSSGTLFIGAITTAIPITAKRLNIFDPTTFPIAISCSPFRAAITEAASSGKEVPRATIVKPIIKSLTPNSTATPTAPQTSILELTINKISPKTSQTIPSFKLIECSFNSISISLSKLSPLLFKAV